MYTSFLDHLIGALLCVLGALLARTRRRRATGLLLLATGATWLLGSALPEAVFLYRGPLVQLLVTYPGGRPKGRHEQVVVLLGYLDTVQAIGRNQWLTAGLALVVAGTVLAGHRRAAGAARRARLTSSIATFGMMGILAFGAVARLIDAHIDPQFLAVYQFAVLTSAVALFVDARWGWWNSAAITTLVIDLGRSNAAEGVRDKVARALGDPALELGFFDAGTGSLVDETGHSVRLSPGSVSRQRTSLRRDGQEIATVVHAPGALDDPALLSSVTSLTALAVSNARLQAGVLARVAEVGASRRRILEVSDRERQTLEAELREVAQLRLDRVDHLLEPDDELRGLLNESRSSLNDFARGVHPRSLEEGGLAAACRELARAAPVPVVVEVPAVRLSPEVELSLFFVCSEALTNVAKYARASAASVNLVQTGDYVRLSISDNGCGGAALGEPGLNRGTGLRGLADRLAVIGGAIHVESSTSRGTTVIAQVPRRPR